MAIKTEVGLFQAAPDGSVWLQVRSDDDTNLSDGIARFDGRSATRYLHDHAIHGMDIARDGSVWLIASEPPPRLDDGSGIPMQIHVITPEAVAAAQ